MKRKDNTPSRASSRGLTLIELLVAIVIAMVVVLAATSVLVLGEAHKRSTNSSNDASQSGNFAAYVLDRALRSAGSGFAQAWDQGVFGCKLGASYKIGGTATAILPRTSEFPAPFQGFLSGAQSSLGLAPMLIGQGMSAGGSDVLMVMSGNGSAGDVARPIRSSVGGSDLRLDNTIGLADGDLGLVVQPGNANCLLEQVKVTDATAFNAVSNDVLPMGGDYANTSALASMANAGNASFSMLGNVAAGNVQFQLFGVDANRTLVAYDLLRSAAVTGNMDPVLPLADNVAEMRAIYGIDTNFPYDNVVDSWVAPSGAWAIDKVLADPKLMRQIVAVRVAIVTRASNYEKTETRVKNGALVEQDVATERPALFADTPAKIDAVSFAANSDNRHFRLRVIDTTIPLRNMLLLPGS